MKTIIIIFASVALFSELGFAQEKNTDFREELKFGIKAGINLSNVYDSEGEEFDADSKFGLAAGAFLSIPIGKYLGVQPELLLSQKGFQASGRLFDSPYSFTRTTTYIDIPLLIAFKPTQFLTIVGGPQYSYLTKQKDVFDIGNLTAEQETAFENDNMRKNTLCFTGGADINLNRLVIGMRAGWDLQNNNGNGTTTIPRYKNAWYQATIGFRI